MLALLYEKQGNTSPTHTWEGKKALTSEGKGQHRKPCCRLPLGAGLGLAADAQSKAKRGQPGTEPPAEPELAGRAGASSAEPPGPHGCPPRLPEESNGKTKSLTLCKENTNQTHSVAH